MAPVIYKSKIVHVDIAVASVLCDLCENRWDIDSVHPRIVRVQICNINVRVKSNIVLATVREDAPYHRDVDCELCASILCKVLLIARIASLNVE